MNKINTLIHYLDEHSKENTNYFTYASVINKIIDYLTLHKGDGFMLYNTDSERFADSSDVIQEILHNHPNDIEIIAHVYDSVGLSDLVMKERGKHTVRYSTLNNIFYFSQFEVALVTIPIYTFHHQYNENLLFAKSDDQILEFVSYFENMEKNYMLNGITIFTDTEDGLIRSKEKITHQINREDVLLEESLKSDIFRSIDEFFLNSGQFFKQYNIPYKRGILLYGSPGNGKTTLVKSIAGSVSAPIVYWQITEYTSSYSIREIFSKVLRLAPMVLVIEDIDSMPTEARSVFLNTLDGATTKEGIFLIGTTNYPEKIDPALINRAGRFDRAYEIKQPDEVLRREYIVNKKGIDEFLTNSAIEELVQKTKGLSISQLNEIYMSIALESHYNKHVNIDKIINDLQENTRKAQKQDWISEPSTGRVGF
ncbi:ATP-binding protein [Ornithinibacillus massiliensis]|uniref:ATP-binding protein n=1 Tax=Ornithinibacillus massiliensis TaxID=1944633 RepID=A0ABS5MDI1_9BACI|nr:ATP-binding protein [Ornithinibacillus massiliensis]MBS3680386.1 ATP-binding protein [Ornithinibacillus massiliensis]